MKKIIWLWLFFCCIANADQLTNEINSFAAVEEQNAAAARDLVRVQADYARQQAELKQAAIIAERQKVEQKERNVRAEAKAAADKADADFRRTEAIRLANEKANKDREDKKEQREDGYEDQVRAVNIEERKAKLELELEEKKTNLDMLKAKSARVDEYITQDIKHDQAVINHEQAETNVVQSKANEINALSEGQSNLQKSVARSVENVSEGQKSLLTDEGKSLVNTAEGQKNLMTSVGKGSENSLTDNSNSSTKSSSKGFIRRLIDRW